MERRVAEKLARHRREGVTYPNAGSPYLDQERQRLEIKLARHKAAQLIEEKLELATRPDADKAPAPEAKSASPKKG